VKNLSTITDSALEFGKEAKETIEKLARSAEKLARTASDSLDQKRGDTGSALHTAASSIRDAGRQGAQKIDNLTSGAADKLHSTATYIEGHDVKGMLAGFASRHPAPSLVVAAAMGFFVGSALMRMRR
jgi:ElaB/YqjD/DUF883 family membrane-anchored ribosome-binding protein